MFKNDISLEELGNQYIESADMLKKRISELKKENHNGKYTARIVLLRRERHDTLAIARYLKSYYTTNKGDN